MGSRVVTPEEVLESLMNDGTIDAIRMKIIAQLKANVSFLMLLDVSMYVHHLFVSMRERNLAS